MPTDRAHRLPQQAQPRAIRPHRPQPSTSDAATQLRHARPAPNERRYTRYVALHPIRRDAPVTSRRTRYVAMHPIRRGVMPTDRAHRLPQQAQPRAIRPHRPQPSTSDAATQLRHARPAPNERRYTRYVAMHPLRRDTPVTSQCTRSEGVQCLRIGCTAPHNKPNRGHFLPTHPSDSIRRSHTTSKYPPGSLQEALHPIRRATPVTSRCTRSEGVSCLRIGCSVTEQQAQLRKN